MKIQFLCASGSPLGVVPPDVYKKGVGGAELALVSLAEVLGQRGHEVTVYNDPQPAGTYEHVSYRPLREYNHVDERDALVLFRVPHHTFPVAKGKKIFWSCDQFTAGNYKKDIFPYAEKIVCISERHKKYFEDTYGIGREDPRVYVTNLGVRMEDYAQNVDKIPGRMIYCSVPGRGLVHLAKIWPRVKEVIPHATLVITGDYSLWGLQSQDSEFRLMFLGTKDVNYRGQLPRNDMVIEQLRAEVQIYPCSYDELFCIAAAECAYAGAIPVTSEYGALPTTNKMGIRVPGLVETAAFQTEFVEKLEKLYADPELMHLVRANAQLHAKLEFDWNTIALLWEQMVLA
jgi:glycosyltransferase involved in cell wall biosynthesis